MATPSLMPRGAPPGGLKRACGSAMISRDVDPASDHHALRLSHRGNIPRRHLTTTRSAWSPARSVPIDLRDTRTPRSARGGRNGFDRRESARRAVQLAPRRFAPCGERNLRMTAMTMRAPSCAAPGQLLHLGKSCGERRDEMGDVVGWSIGATLEDRQCRISHGRSRRTA